LDSFYPIIGIVRLKYLTGLLSFLGGALDAKLLLIAMDIPAFFPKLLILLKKIRFDFGPNFQYNGYIELIEGSLAKR